MKENWLFEFADESETFFLEEINEMSITKYWKDK